MVDSSQFISFAPVLAATASVGLSAAAIVNALRIRRLADSASLQGSSSEDNLLDRHGMDITDEDGSGGLEDEKRSFSDLFPDVGTPPEDWRAKTNSKICLALKQDNDNKPLPKPDSLLDFSYREWSHVLLEAEREIWISGISLWGQTSPANREFFRPVMPEFTLPDTPNAHISELIAYAIGRGVDVSILLMDPENPALNAMLQQPLNSATSAADLVFDVRNKIERSDRTWLQVRQQIAETAEAEKWADLGSLGSMRIVQVREGLVPQKLIWTEKTSVSATFFNCILDNRSWGPAARAPAGHIWHRLFREQLQILADHNPEAAVRVTSARSNSIRRSGVV